MRPASTLEGCNAEETPRAARTGCIFTILQQILQFEDLICDLSTSFAIHPRTLEPTWSRVSLAWPWWSLWHRDDTDGTRPGHCHWDTHGTFRHETDPQLELIPLARPHAPSPPCHRILLPYEQTHAALKLNRCSWMARLLQALPGPKTKSPGQQ